jgi:hypothetical protein
MSRSCAPYLGRRNPQEDKPWLGAEFSSQYSGAVLERHLADKWMLGCFRDVAPGRGLVLRIKVRDCGVEICKTRPIKAPTRVMYV